MKANEHTPGSESSARGKRHTAKPSPKKALAGGDRATLTHLIGALAMAAKPTNIHAFIVLDILAGAMLTGREDAFATAALAWFRYGSESTSTAPDEGR